MVRGGVKAHMAVPAAVAVLAVLNVLPGKAAAFSRAGLVQSAGARGGLQVGRLGPARARVAPLRASLLDPVEGGADGSMEKLLGNVGLGKVGKGIDWFFDTSTISGAKAWRHQQIAGEADAQRFRQGDELEEMLQDQISSRTLQRSELQAAVAEDDDAMFSDGGFSYSLDDTDLAGSLTARLEQLTYDESASRGLLTGAELALMCYKKYGLYHDMALKCDMLQVVYGVPGTCLRARIQCA